jgi:hypothetical protein
MVALHELGAFYAGFLSGRKDNDADIIELKNECIFNVIS